VNETLHLGPLTIVPAARKILRDGRDVPVTPKEFEVFHILARRAGQLVPSPAIQREVWRAVSQCTLGCLHGVIYKLKKKFQDVTIKSTIRVGYTLRVPGLEERPAGEETAGTEAEAEPAEDDTVTLHAQVSLRRSRFFLEESLDTINHALETPGLDSGMRATLEKSKNAGANGLFKLNRSGEILDKNLGYDSMPDVVPLRLFISDVLDIFSPLLARKGVEPRVNVADHHVVVHEPLVKDLLFCGFEDAIKLSPPGGVIEVEGVVEGQSLRLTVSTSVDRAAPAVEKTDRSLRLRVIKNLFASLDIPHIIDAASERMSVEMSFPLV